MNHFKTFIFNLVFLCFCYSQIADASLNRALKPNEISTLKRNIDKDPNNIKSRLFLGHHYHRVKDWNGVITYLSPVAEKLPDDAIFKLAKSYLEIGKYRDAESIANILLSKEKIKTKHYLLATKIIAGILDTAKLDPYEIEETRGKKKVKILIDPRKPIVDSLYNTLKDAQKQNPTNAEIYDVWLEMLETYEEHYAHDGLKVMEDMKKYNIPFTPRITSLQCKYHYMADYADQAKKSCQTAIDADPGDPSNYIYLGKVHVSTGDDKKGKRMLASVGEKFSNSEEALWATADSYLQSKDITSAYTFFKKASYRKDAKARDFLGLGQTAFELKKYDEALNAFVKHCKMAGVFSQEFRRASGLLKENLRMQELYRQKMMDCKQNK